MECAAAPVDHLAFFYEDRSQLIAKVASFAEEGLRLGESVMLIATGEHLDDIATLLASRSVDTGRLRVFDAATTLKGFFHNGEIDRDAFTATIGSLVGDAVAAGPVRLFGEMVALLWDEGFVRSALELEALWCDLRQRDCFTLLCAYPSSVVLDGHLQAPANAVCELHSELTIGEHGEATLLRIYPPTLDAVREARRFVRSCVSGDACCHNDIMLVTSELSSNAVHHAQSAFAVQVSLRGDRLRIGVRDTSSVSPRLMPMSTGTAESGRGIATVAALSERWGIETHTVGKTVWAELAL